MKPKRLVKGGAEELLDFVRFDSFLVDVDLEEVALAGGVDADGDGIGAEGPFEHRLRQVDQGEAAEEIRAAQGAEVGGIGRVKNRRRKAPD